MKTTQSALLTFYLLLSAFFISNAQCDGRYLEEIFAGVDVTTVTYSDSFNLEMDIYEPSGDTLAHRPVIVFAHGGAYYAGSKNNQSMIDLCTSFAKRGYVTASIQYRLASSVFDLLDSLTAVDIVVKSVSDMKAAVRYFRMDADNADAYRIDPTQIFVGGNSAGAVTSVHLAFIDSAGEVPAHVANAINNNGGIDGNSGNPGYSWQVSGVINLAGAINVTAWIDANDEPIVSAHGDDDMTVPYICDQPLQSLTNQFPGTIDIIDLCGSGPIDERADQLGVISSLMTFKGFDHVPWSYDADIMDTVMTYVAAFLYQNLDCSNTTTFNLPDVTYDTSSAPPTGIVKPLEFAGIQVYPNPVEGFVAIDQIDFNGHPYNISVFDRIGRLIHEEQNLTGPNWRLNTSNYDPGMYIIRLENNADPLESRTVKVYFN